MDVSNLSAEQRRIRGNIRNYIYPMTVAEMQREAEIRRQNGDHFAARCVEEMIAEDEKLLSELT